MQDHRIWFFLFATECWCCGRVCWTNGYPCVPQGKSFYIWPTFFSLAFLVIFVNKPCWKMQARGDHHRDVCIIPVSAHGTNPASAAMVGMKIVAVGTDSKGNINIEELRKAAEANKDNLSALMVLFLCPANTRIYIIWKNKLIMQPHWTFVLSALLVAHLYVVLMLY